MAAAAAAVAGLQFCESSPKRLQGRSTPPLLLLLLLFIQLLLNRACHTP
jgi:hypothetical protein